MSSSSAEGEGDEEADFVGKEALQAAGQLEDEEQMEDEDDDALIQEMNKKQTEIYKKKI